ncbi:MAG: glycosyltransferase family 2 protein [Bacteroidales bacterium]|nr:glycosyltransferase family 2 protein [Bacteroidales bacterium]
MPQLSVVIITLNEEKNIGRCIDSIKDIADEIVVVDSFSTDKTRQICESENVRFILHEFEGYIEQKIYASSQAKFPYILSLDADEALSEELKKSIIKVKENWNFDGYTMNRLTNYCGKWIKHCGWYPDKKLRLFDSRLGKWTGVNPHDEFVLKTGAKTTHLKGDILHYSYYSLEEHLKQIEKFTDISSKELFKNGKKFSSFKLIFNPVFKFIRDYFFNLGFLDGRLGYIICKYSAKATYLKYYKLIKLHQQKK